MEIELHELVEKVNDEKSFLVFVQALIQDRSLEDPNSIDPFGHGKGLLHFYTVEKSMNKRLITSHKMNAFDSNAFSTRPFERYYVFSH